MIFQSSPGLGADRPESPGDAADALEIVRAARTYLDAEVARELKTVFDCLAPSSVYRKTHDYAAYLAEAEASPVRIRAYRILRVAHIRANADRQQFPLVDTFAEVEVELRLHFTDTDEAAEVNVMFTFIKEDGRWYKG